MTRPEDFEIVNGELVAFRGDPNETGLVLPEGVISINWWAFPRADYRFTSVECPNSLTVLHSSPFQQFQRLEKVTLSPFTTEIGDETFCGCASLREVVNTDRIKKLGFDAFEKTALVRISLPAIEDLGSGAFYNCRALTEVTLSNTIRRIPSRCFRFCAALKSFTIPESVTHLGNGAFYGAGLTSLYIPKTVRYIDFYGNPGSEWYPLASAPTEISVDPENPYFCVENGKVKMKTFHEEGGLHTVYTGDDGFERFGYKRYFIAGEHDKNMYYLVKLRYGEEEMRRFAEECARYCFQKDIESIEGNDDYNIESTVDIRTEFTDIGVDDAVISNGEIIGFICDSMIVLKDDTESVIETVENYRDLSYYRYAEDECKYRLVKKSDETK